ncbi:MAG: heparinase II/III family protein [Candidatus Hinthialibacter antarcticus]|nr:heparinase II/III family protein [Candidatus Hinthialibacter antarcticus]
MNRNGFYKTYSFAFCVLFFISFACVPLVVGGELDATYPPSATLDQIKEVIKQAPKGHPRLMMNPSRLDELIRQNKDDPRFQSLKSLVIQHADHCIGLPPVERVLQGRRLLGQSRECLRRTVLLSMAYHLSGDMKYVQRCEKEMLQASSFQDWNPSHFLDVAEMTLAMAIGYDWLYNQLEDDTRQTVREAIIQKGASLPFTTKHKGWVKSTNNWGQVCHGGLTAGALAILEDEPELAAKTVHNALQNVTRSVEVYDPKGSYPEGPSYWSYGTSYNVVLIEALESVLGSDFGLSKAPGFIETGQYLSIVTGPSGQTFNYSDGGSRRGAEAAVFWFASKFNRPDWAVGESKLLDELITQSKNTSRGDRFLPFTLLWMQKQPNNTSMQAPLHWEGGGHVPVTVHRSSWTDPNAVFVGMKGGAPSANHGQMDIGSFVLDADGVRWAVDLGAESYHGIEARGMNLWDRSQNSDRWTIFRQQNKGHNTLVINDQLQVAKNSGDFMRFSDAAQAPFSIVDLSKVYEAQAQSVKRGIAMTSSNEVLVQDELTGLKPGASVRWAMITPANVVKKTDAALELRQAGKSLTLTNMTSGEPVEWQIVDISKPPNEWDSANRGMTMIVLNAQAPQNGKVNFAVLATPGSCSQSVKGSLKLSELSEWGK